MTKIDKIAYIPTDWAVLKYEYDDRTGRVYRIEQRTHKDGNAERRRIIERE